LKYYIKIQFLFHISGLTIFFGLFLEKANFPPLGQIIMGAYTAVGLTLYIILEVHTYYTTKSKYNHCIMGTKLLNVKI